MTETQEKVTSDQKVATLDMKLEAVIIPVSDVDRAKDFYGGLLGWRLDADFRFDNGFRVFQFTPPGSGCSIQFGTNMTKAAPGSAQNLYLVVSDIVAARDQLVARGVRVAAPRSAGEGPDGGAAGPRAKASGHLGIDPVGADAGGVGAGAPGHAGGEEGPRRLGRRRPGRGPRQGRRGGLAAVAAVCQPGLPRWSRLPRVADPLYWTQVLFSEPLAGIHESKAATARMCSSHNFGGSLFLAQDKVHDPAAADVRAAAAAVGNDLLVVAVGVHQGVGQKRHPVERPVFVDAAGQAEGVASAPAGVESHDSEGIADDVAKGLEGWKNRVSAPAAHTGESSNKLHQVNRLVEQTYQDVYGKGMTAEDELRRMNHELSPAYGNRRKRDNGPRRERLAVGQQLGEPQGFSEEISLVCKPRLSPGPGAGQEALPPGR